MSMEKIADRHRIRGGRHYAILSHGLRTFFGQDIHSDKRRRTHLGYPLKRRERLQDKLFQRWKIRRQKKNK